MGKKTPYTQLSWVISVSTTFQRGLLAGAKRINVVLWNIKTVCIDFKSASQWCDSSALSCKTQWRNQTIGRDNRNM